MICEWIEVDGKGGQHISYEDGTCKRCISSILVDDEYHALFVCSALLAFV
jgi:hypothetical protein